LNPSMRVNLKTIHGPSIKPKTIIINYNYKKKTKRVNTIVFRPSPVQDPGQLIFLKNQNDIVLAKKKKSTSCNRVFDRVARSAGSHRVFSSPIFFQLAPIPTPGRPGTGSTRRIEPGFKTMIHTFMCMYSDCGFIY
jgi:hypothetical protein